MRCRNEATASRAADGLRLADQTGVTYELVRDPGGDVLIAFGGAPADHRLRHRRRPHGPVLEPQLRRRARCGTPIDEVLLAAPAGSGPVTAMLAAVIDAPLALAFGAGMLAAVNPCGFAMLPAYLSYFCGLEGSLEEGAGSTRTPPAPGCGPCPGRCR